MVIHAARHASLVSPVKPLPPIWAVLGDIVVGLCFAWVIGQFLKKYVAMKRLDLRNRNAHTKTSFSAVTMLSFLAVYAVLVLLFFLVADHLFSFYGIVITPLIIALFMLIDGFISGPIEQVSELIEKDEERTQHHQMNPTLGVASRLSSGYTKTFGQIVWRIKYATFVSVLGYGGWLLLPHGVH